MSFQDIDSVTEIYAQVLDPTYISFSELAEGKGEALGRLSEQAVSIFRKQLVVLHHSPRHGFFVATADEKVIGFSLASTHRAEAGHLECWLDDIAVSPQWQRCGVARRLVEQVISWGAEQGARYYLLESGVQNTVAHHLFVAAGFRPLSVVFWKNGDI